jgi:succinoglycan biosynthesis transport protein ExoP
MESPDDGRELPDYFGFLRRQALVIILAVLVVTGAAVGLLAQTASVYTSHASVLVQPLASGASSVVGGRTDGAINLDTEAQILKSTSIAQSVQKQLNTTATTTALIGRLSVAVPANSSVMTIGYQAHSPAKAAAGAQAFAQAYLANRAATANADVKEQVNSYLKQRAALQAELLAVTKRLQIESASSSAGIYDRQQKTLVTNEIQDLNSNLNTLQGQVVIPGQIIGAAVIPGQPSGPNSQLYIVSGVIAGLVLGLLLGLARDGRRRRRLAA